MSYPGAKSGNGVWQRIIGQMPPHDLYVEPFAGSAHVFFQKLPARQSILLDTNPGTVDALRRRLMKTNLDVGLYGLEAIDWLNANKLWLWDRKAVVYCDPPYPLSTRFGRRYYDHEFTDQEHTSLLTLLQALKCYVMISGVDCPLYSSALRNWRRVRYRTRWHDKTVMECLWCNFPEPEVLHDWRYAGNNHRQRTSLKRLKSRWLAKLDKMKPRQRGYVLDAIGTRHFQQGAPARPSTPLLALTAAYVKAGVHR